MSIILGIAHNSAQETSKGIQREPQAQMVHPIGSNSRLTIRNRSSQSNRKEAKMSTSQQALLYATCAVVLSSLLLVCCVAQGEASHSLALDAVRRNRIKRSLFELPDGADLLVGRGKNGIRTSFTCDGLGYGYYADPDNDCKIFHVCQSFKMSDGSIYNNHWSFVCGNQTVFNQVSLSCSHPEDSVPCENARDFYHVNDYFGDVRAPSVKDSDLGAAHELVARAYGSRLAPSR